MRRAILNAIGSAVCGLTICAALPLLAQQSATRPGSPARSTVAATKATNPAAQPVIDATSLGSPMALNKGWRVGITADLQAANPDFDDSSWSIRDAQSSIEDVSEPDDEPKSSSTGHVQVVTPYDEARPGNSRRYAWFRLHLRLAPNHGPLALLVELPVSQNALFVGTNEEEGVDVFANGQPIAPEGLHGNAPQRYQQISRLYDLNVPAAQTTLTIAMRIHYRPFGYGAYTSFFADRTMTLGHPVDLQPILNSWSTQNILQRLPRLVYSILLVVLAFFLLALFIAQKGHPEYLWLALHYLVQAPIGFVEQAGSSARLDTLWYAAIVPQLVVISAYLFFEFLVAFLSLPRRWYIRWMRYTSPILAGIAPMLLSLLGHRGTGSAAGMAVVFLGSILWMLTWLVFVFGTLIKATLRRNFEAGLLLIPLLLSIVGIIEPMVIASMTSTTGHQYRSPLTLMAGPIPIQFASIADFTGILVIVLIIFGRFLRIQNEANARPASLRPRAACRN